MFFGTRCIRISLTGSVAPLFHSFDPLRTGCCCFTRWSTWMDLQGSFEVLPHPTIQLWRIVFWVRTSPKLWVLWAVGRVKCLSDLVTRTVLLLMICILFFSKFGWQFQSSLILKRTMYYGSQQNPNRSIQDCRFFRTLKTPTKNSCFSAILALSLEVDATLKKLLEHNAYKTQTHKSTNIHRIFTHLGMFINHAI